MMKKIEEIFSLVIIIEFILNEFIFVKGAPLEDRNIIHQKIFDTDLNHLAVDHKTGNVYVGGRNRLFQLSPDLQSNITVEIGPRNECDVFDCIPDVMNEIIDNVNKVLLIDYNKNRLITCNTIPMGSCSTRNLQNISFPEQNVMESVVADESTVAFLAPGISCNVPETSTSVMYVGVTATINQYNRMDVPAVSTRCLEDGRLFHLSSVSPNIGTLISIRPILPIYKVRYVYGFSSEGFSYFVTTQPKNVKSKEHRTKLVRVCQNDPHYYSYTEIPVDCMSEDQSIKYNLAEASFLGKAGADLAESLGIKTADDILYAVFSDSKNNVSTNKSAVCIYSLKSIRLKFTENIQSCFDGHGLKGLKFFLHDEENNSNNSCIKKNLTITEDFCGSDVNYPIGGEQAVNAVPIAVYQTRLTAIIAIQHRRFTAVFVGTANGHLKKIIIESRTLGVEYADIGIHENSAVNADLQFDSKDQHLYVMTKDRVTKVKLYDCADFLHCPVCTSTKDPYCEWCFIENKCISSNINNFFIIGVVTGLIILFVTTIFVIIVINETREKILRQKWIDGSPEKISPELTLLEQADYLPYVERYEFSEEKLEIGNKLGEGAFGVVYKAVAREILPHEEETIVAVKKNKEEAIEALIKELKIMCHLGKHLNVVNLLGAVTKNVRRREIMVIVEYCMYGNLQNVLRSHRSTFINQINEENDTIDFARTSNNRPGTSRQDTTNAGYRPRSPFDNGSVALESELGRQITTTDLVCWAFQIAQGMDYLASRKVVHGDLAARNVLLCDDNVVKICDFGLARSLDKHGNYHKKGEDKLPVKWLALESLDRSVFNTRTDVWSFGIVLWELFSLGQKPYPGMIADYSIIFKWLKDGNRMPKPEFARGYVYNIMLSCWDEEPELRPSFDELMESISDSIPEKSIIQRYIDLNEPFLEANSSHFQSGQTDYLGIMSNRNYLAMNSLER